LTVVTIDVFGFCLVYTQGLSDGTFNLLLVGLLVSFIIGTTSVGMLIHLIRIRTLPPDQPSTPKVRNR
jgi:hypothetical protein